MSVAPVAETPARDPCRSGADYSALSSLISHSSLVDARVGGAPGARVRQMDLAALFPAARRQGYTVLAVTTCVPFAGRAFIALVAPADAVIVRDRDVAGAALGVLTCESEGWALVAPPAPLPEGLPQLGAHALVRLTEGRYGETVAVRAVAQTLEYSTSAYVLGRGDDALPVRSPPGAPYGVLAELGTVGERVVAEGTSEYRTLAPLGATGWYPFGPERVFLRVARDRRPAAAGRWTDRVLTVARARLGAQGFTIPTSDDEDVGEAWVLVGPGAQPAWCNGRDDLRCAPLDPAAEGLPRGSVPFAWMAGAWPVGSAIPRDLAAPGARWLHVGTAGQTRRPRDPGGHAPLTALDVRPTGP